MRARPCFTGLGLQSTTIVVAGGSCRGGSGMATIPHAQKSGTVFAILADRICRARPQGVFLNGSYELVTASGQGSISVGLLQVMRSQSAGVGCYGFSTISLPTSTATVNGVRSS